MYNGWTPNISKQEADNNMEATLRAMVAEYPDNEYWRNRLADFLSEIETQHDLEWLKDAEAEHADWLDEMATRESVRP